MTVKIVSVAEFSAANPGAVTTVNLAEGAMRVTGGASGSFQQAPTRESTGATVTGGSNLRMRVGGGLKVEPAI